MIFFKCTLFALAVIAFSPSIAADSDRPMIDSRFIGTWKGSWLEGMSSGKVTLEVGESRGDLSLTTRPAFGTQAVAIAKIVGVEKQLGFYATGADGHAMRFNLTPDKDYKTLKGKAYFDGLHMELDLTRAPID
jgi:hypothetical protein